MMPNRLFLDRLFPVLAAFILFGSVIALYVEALKERQEAEEPEPRAQYSTPEGTEIEVTGKEYKGKLPPASLNISENGNILITIHPDGRVELAPGVKPDAASKAFWKAITVSFPQFCTYSKITEQK